MQAIEASIATSPGRATTYFIKAQMQLFRNEYDDAVATMKQAIALNPNYSEGYCRLAQIFFLIKDDNKYDSEIGETMNNCVDKGGAANINSVNFLKLGINYYSDDKVKDYNRAAILSERLAEISDPDPEVWYNQARLYYVINNKEKAEESFQKALALDPTLTPDWQEFKLLIDANRKEE